MDNVVIYESLWGNTAAVADAIASGLGSNAVALTTDQATPTVIANAQLIVVGSPVHAMNLPTEGSRASASTKVYGKPGLHADVSHTSIREWLETVPSGDRRCAAFETGIRGPLGHGAAKAILKQLSAAGLTPISDPHTFTVALVTRSSEPAALLLPGQEEKARRWGEQLAAFMGKVASPGVAAD